jgi:dienelactone hydrolase
MASTHCVDPGAKQTHESQGYEEEVAGVNTYKTGQGKSAIVIFSDIFGFAFPNTRKVADRFADATVTTVLIPDCFHGDAVDSTTPNYRDTLPEWIKRHPVDEVCDLADNFISTIKGQYQSIQVIEKIFSKNIVN